MPIAASYLNMVLLPFGACVPGERFGPLAIVEQHTDISGERTPLSSKRIMVVNAGEGLQYEESAPLIEAEVLQEFIRLARAGGEAKNQLLERADGIARNDWTWLAGPEESDAPLTLRQAVHIYDARLERGKSLEARLRTMAGALLAGGSAPAQRRGCGRYRSFAACYRRARRNAHLFSGGCGSLWRNERNR